MPCSHPEGAKQSIHMVPARGCGSLRPNQTYPTIRPTNQLATNQPTNKPTDQASNHALPKRCCLFVLTEAYTLFYIYDLLVKTTSRTPQSCPPQPHSHPPSPAPSTPAPTPSSTPTPSFTPALTPTPNPNPNSRFHPCLRFLLRQVLQRPRHPDDHQDGRGEWCGEGVGRKGRPHVDASGVGGAPREGGRCGVRWSCADREVRALGRGGARHAHGIRSVVDRVGFVRFGFGLWCGFDFGSMVFWFMFFGFGFVIVLYFWFRFWFGYSCLVWCRFGC